MRRALSGVTVVELAGDIAGAYCGKLLADLGAEVVKVEEPGGGELRSRDAGPRDEDGSCRDGLVLHLNSNKRSAVFDPREAGERRAVGELVAGADVVVESRHRGDLAGWGLAWEDVRERRPRLTTVHISGFGANGPYADYRWDDIVAQAFAASFLPRRELGQPPVRLPGHAALCFVGHVAALGAVSALLVAERGEGGAFVDCAAVEALATLPMRQAELLGFEYRDRTHQSDEFRAAGGTLIPTGVFPCADGYVALMSTTQQLNEMLEVLGDPALKAAFEHPDAFNRPETKEAIDAALYPWLLSHTRAEATAEAQAVGWPLAGVNTAGEVLGADHLHQRNFWVHTDDPVFGALDVPGPWCRFAEGGWALRRLAPRLGEHRAHLDEQAAGEQPAGEQPAGDQSAGPPARPSRPPLEGIRVVDLTVVWSGPYATMLLADLGAEVIRVENPFVLPPTTKGYHPRPVLSNPGALGSLYGPARPGAPDRPWNRHAMNNSLARNKLSVTIDNRRPDGHELVMRLAERADVFIDNFKADGLDRVGIDVTELRRRNPSLVVVRLPPAGLTGDWTGYTGFGAQFDALTGLASVCGHWRSDLTATPATTYMDGASGPAGAMAVLAALRYRSATGRGQFVELSQSENVINHLGDVFVDFQLGTEPQRWGNRHPWRAPQGLYRCQGDDRWLAISVGDDRDWRALAGVIGRPELGDDPRFADARGRREHHDELDGIVEAWTASQPQLDAFHALQAAGVAAGPLLDEAGLVTDANMTARGWFRPLYSDDVGSHLHPGLAFTGVPHAWGRGSPTLGEDNEYVYKKLLGVSDEEYQRYERERILATDYLRPDGTPY